MRTLVTTGGRRAATDVEEITRCFANCAVDGFWLDIESPDETDYQLLEETFKFHSLTIEDVRHQNQRPKVDEYPDYNFAVIFQAEWRDDDIKQKASPESLNRIYHLKSQVTEMRRFLGAQRDVFQRLITHGIHLQQQDMTLYYRDVYDHIVRQYETVDSVRDLLTSAMDVYLSTVSNRLNQTVKALTVIASLFLPLSFLTGFYGMNFALLVSVLEAPYVAFFIGVGTMVLAIGFQLFLFRRRGWI